MIDFKKLFMTLTCCVLIINNDAQADIWVGDVNDLNCNFNNIQAAINFIETGGDNTIRIANNVTDATYFENLNFDNSNVTGTFVIQGGYDQCLGNAIETPVTIDGGGTAPVFNISGDNTDKAVVINNLVLKNGLYDQQAEHAGGLNIIGDELDVFFNNTSINQNTGRRGGGLYSQGNNQTLYLYSVNLFNNTAQNGGGLACDGSSVFIRQPSAISFNAAESGVSGEGNGGGVYMNLGCFVSLQSGDNSVAGISGIIGNDASNHGGGAYVATTSRLSISEREGEIPVIKGNRADVNNSGSGFGGGIYATGNGTTVDFRSGVLSDNQAANGGGIAAVDQADVDVFQNSSSCPRNQPCTLIDGNQAGLSLNGVGLGAGGAFYANNEASISALRSSVINNQADSGVVAAVNGGGFIGISTSFITDNGSINSNDFNNNYLLVTVDDNSRINLGNVTVANNDIDSSVALVAFGASIQSEFSIIQDDVVDVLETFNDSGVPIFTKFDCNVLHETQSVNGGNVIINNLASTAVDFVNPAMGDYHILPSSVAIDLCDGSNSWPFDIDGDSWGFDDPNVINVNGVFDAGADETYATDIIFKDGF